VTSIIQFPHPSLSTPTRPWKFSVPTRGLHETRDDVECDPGLERLFGSLVLSMPDDALALAANQVGRSERAFLLSTQVCDETLLPRLIVNPKRLPDAPWPTCTQCLGAGALCATHKATQTEFEGCLSFDGVRVRVTRPLVARFEFYDIMGNERQATLKGLPARVFIHEIEHLDGKTFLDGMSQTDRASVRVKMFNRMKRKK